MSQRTRAGLLALCLLTVLWGAAFLVPLPYVIYKPGPTVDILAEIHKAPGRNVRWDSHNLAPTTKAIIDGMVDAGMLADDNTARVYWVATVDGGRREEPGVTVTVTPTRARNVR